MKTFNAIVLYNSNTHVGIEKKTLEDDLMTFYKVIQCDCIDIVVRAINGTYYNIILDDEGLLKSNHKLSMIEEHKQEGLVGTLIITGINQEQQEELGTLTNEESDKLFKYLLKHRDYSF